MVKGIVINIFSFFNKLLLKIEGYKVSGIFFKVSVKSLKNNVIEILDSVTIKSKFYIDGTGNRVSGKKAYISDCHVTIKGVNNKLIIGEKVKLRGATIIIRGSGCKIEIGSRTTFGGVRIVNVGEGNEITIGEDCLFSDHIEIWGSDTHSIYDEYGKFINREKPVKIGNKVWVGSRVIILKGVTICDGGIVGMGTVLTRDVPAGAVTVGSPNKIIKENVTWDLYYPETRFKY